MPSINVTIYTYEKQPGNRKKGAHKAQRPVEDFQGGSSFSFWPYRTCATGGGQAIDRSQHKDRTEGVRSGGWNCTPG